MPKRAKEQGIKCTNRAYNKEGATKTRTSYNGKSPESVARVQWLKQETKEKDKVPAIGSRDFEKNCGRREMNYNFMRKINKT